jgi:F0F1-type ATP synthase membrane subunit c/vacuolar-type H+-ATPase subunit K
VSLNGMGAGGEGIWLGNAKAAACIAAARRMAEVFVRMVIQEILVMSLLATGLKAQAKPKDTGGYG